MKKLQSIQLLNEEYTTLLAENKKTYPQLKQVRAKMIRLMTAKNNVERILYTRNVYGTVDFIQ